MTVTTSHPNRGQHVRALFTVSTRKRVYQLLFNPLQLDSEDWAVVLFGLKYTFAVINRDFAEQR